MITLSQGCVTPVSNTGLIPHRPFICSVDTLTLVFRKVPSARCAKDIQALVERTFSEKIDFDTIRPTFMMKQWDGCSRASLLGTQLHWLAPKGEGQGTLRLHLPGKALSAASSHEKRDLIQVLWRVYAGECTRIDVAADDYEKITNLDDVKRAQQDRNYTGVRSHRWAGSGSLTERDGLTYYFGSKSSDSQLRVYDKTIESKGVTDCIRWELQLRRAKAQELCTLWLAGDASEETETAGVLSGAIAGAVDFIDRSSGAKDLTRCHRLSWWSRVRGCLARAFKIRPAQKVPTMEKKIGWLCHAVMPSLAAVKKFMGDAEFWQFVEDEVAEKSPLLSPMTLAMVDQAKENERAKMAGHRKLRDAAHAITISFGQMSLDTA